MAKSMNVKICVIGCGAGGAAVLLNFAKRKKETKGFEIVCFEKQKEIGGIWNYTDRTEFDEFGERLQNCMYRHLWINGPKELSLDFIEYPCDFHFGHETPSFITREATLDYLLGFWNQFDIQRFIKFHHVVKSVSFDSDSKKFKVIVHDLAHSETLLDLKFDYVIVASGKHVEKNAPDFEGLHSFPGRVLHTQDLREFESFRNLHVLVIGGSLSAEDVALQCLKFGASKITVTNRKSELGFIWPDGVTIWPLLEKIEGKSCFFKNGSVHDIDAIILCTGYTRTYPFMSKNIRLLAQEGDNNNSSIHNNWAPHLYKGVLWTPEIPKKADPTILATDMKQDQQQSQLQQKKQQQQQQQPDRLEDCGCRLFYILPSPLINSLHFAILQAKFIVDVILGKKEIPGLKDRREDMKIWRDKSEKRKKDFNVEYALDLGGNQEVWLNHRRIIQEMATLRSNCDATKYRDEGFKSSVTGKKGLKPKVKFMENFTSPEEDAKEMTKRKEGKNKNANANAKCLCGCC